MEDKDLRIGIEFIGCGGCGANIIKKIGEFTDDTIILDTVIGEGGKQTLKPSDTMAGSNGELTTNYEHFTSFVHDVIGNHAALTSGNSIKCIIASTSGGSGSMIAQNLIYQLRNWGVPTLLVLVSDTKGYTAVNNSYKTIMTFDNLAKLHGYSQTTLFFTNEDSWEPTNKKIINTLKHLKSFLLTPFEGIDSSEKVSLFAHNMFQSFLVDNGLAHITIADKKINGKYMLVRAVVEDVDTYTTGDELTYNHIAKGKCAPDYEYKDTHVIVHVPGIDDLKAKMRKLVDETPLVGNKEKSVGIVGTDDFNEDGMML